MKRLPTTYKSATSAHRKQAGMVTLTEVMVASVMTAMVVGASSLGLPTRSLISHSKNKATLRQNTVNGLRLMRSEIERSIHLVLNNSIGFQQIVNISTSVTLASQKPSANAPV